MFSKKIRKEMPLELLRVIYEMYLDKHGHGIRNLQDFFVLTTAHELFSMYIPDLMEVKDNVSRPLLLDILKELEGRGFMRSELGYKYFLTLQGYDYSARGRWKKFVDYWNSNPGLNTLVAILSAGIASISLVVAIFAVVKSGSSEQTNHQLQPPQLIQDKNTERPLPLILRHSCEPSEKLISDSKLGPADNSFALPCPLG